MENLSLSLANRLREVVLNGRWIANTNYKEQLSAVSWRQAIEKISDCNTIAALTYHINYYMEGMLRFLETGKLDIHDKFSFDCPEIRTEEEWTQLVSTLVANTERFAAEVEKMTGEKLGEPFFDVKYGDHLRNIEGKIEHCYYHLGQIVLLRKMIGSKN